MPELKASATTASSGVGPTSCVTSEPQQMPSDGESSSPQAGGPSGGSGSETKTEQTSPAIDSFEEDEEEWWDRRRQE